MPYYAQINELSTVIGVTETYTEISAPHMIPIDSLDASLLGSTWSGSEWVQPTPEPAPRHISVGAFFDRFGVDKWAILADQTPSVKAVVQDASVRKYIDLDNPELAGGIALLQQAGHSVDAEAVIDAPVQPGERA